MTFSEAKRERSPKQNHGYVDQVGEAMLGEGEAVGYGDSERGDADFR